ncbi:MAG: 16S rRNA (cytosine(967)-C(5))-methyltransferase RsmB [Eubacterium sp.]
MREYIFDIVFGTLEEKKHSDELFHEICGQDRISHSRDRHFVRREAFGTIERAIELDAYLGVVSDIPVKKMNAVIRTILRMGVYELFYMDKVPASATCNEMVSLSKKKKMGKYAGFVNGILRHLARKEREVLREKIAAKKGDIAEKYSFLYSMPKELCTLMIENYGKKTAKKIFEAFEGANPICIRVHTKNASLEEVRKELEEAQIKVESLPHLKEGFCLSRVDKVEELPGFAEGHFTVQDESSMLPGVISGIKPGDSVLDVCASPGGKTFHAMDLLKGKGRICARDVSEKKLVRIRENAVRLQEPDVEIKVWDARKEDLAWNEKADVILADVPCSGIGVIGKKPEIRYNAFRHIEELVPIQRDIIKGILPALKPGGTLIYSTCTICPQENQENVAYLEKHFPLKRESLDEFLPESLRNKMTKEGMLQILPGVNGSDGFFVARLVKEK